MVVVAGDSDYIALAQRCKQMGRFVVGIGVASSTSRALVAACDVFTDYARLPGVIPPTLVDKQPATTAAATTQDPPTAGDAEEDRDEEDRRQEGDEEGDGQVRRLGRAGPRRRPS